MGRTNAPAKVTTRKQVDFPINHNTSALLAIKDRFARCDSVLNLLHDDGDDPLLLLWRIAKNAEVEPRLRADCAKEVASYLHSKQASVKVSGGDAPIRFTVSWEDNAPVLEAQSHKQVVTFEDAQILEHTTTSSDDQSDDA